MQPDDRIRLCHMADAIESALRFARGRNRAEFDSNEMLLFAVVRAVEVIGEAASRVSAAVREAHPQIPWGAVTGMRNRLVHAYFDVDTDIVWSTVTQALPPLLAQLRAILSSA
jgi:uncharacterized protein with HEPN domain